MRSYVSGLMPCRRPFSTSDTSACEIPSSRASCVCETFFEGRGMREALGAGGGGQCFLGGRDGVAGEGEGGEGTAIPHADFPRNILTERVTVQEKFRCG